MFKAWDLELLLASLPFETICGKLGHIRPSCLKLSVRNNTQDVTIYVRFLTNQVNHLTNMIKYMTKITSFSKKI